MKESGLIDKAIVSFYINEIEMETVEERRDLDEEETIRVPESHVMIGGWDDEVITNIAWVEQDEDDENDWSFHFNDIKYGSSSLSTGIDSAHYAASYFYIASNIDTLYFPAQYGLDLLYIIASEANEIDSKCYVDIVYYRLVCDCTKGIESIYKPL